MSGTLRVLIALSIAGMVLLPLFGLLLRFQPKFVHGLRVDPAKAELNCYIAGGWYGGVFLYSMLALCLTNRRAEQHETEQHVAINHEIFGETTASTKMKKASDKTCDRPESRSSSREDTTIILDSSFDDDHASI